MSSGGGGGGGQAPVGGSDVYDPSEVLSDAIATIVFMPSKFERTTMHLAEKFNHSIEDASSMKSLVDSLVEQCIKEEQFHSLAGRFCSYLAQKVTNEVGGTTLKACLLAKLASVTQQCKDILAVNEGRAHAILTILVDMYLEMVAASADQKWKVHDAELAADVDQIMTILFSNGSEKSITLAAQKFKLCGKILEGEEKFSTLETIQIDEDKSWADQPAPKMDALIALVTSASARSDLPAELRKSLESLADTRSKDKWASAEADNAKAKEAMAKALSQPAPRKSNAIRIEPDPNDARTHQNNPNELTEEELKFISDSIGEDEGSDGDNEEIGESDGGMTEDIADAYEQFLAEQSKNGGK